MKRIVLNRSTSHLGSNEAQVAATLREWGLEGVSLFDLVSSTRTLGAWGGITLHANSWCRAVSRGELEPDIGNGAPQPQKRTHLSVSVTGYSIELALAKTYLLWLETWEQWADKRLSGWPGRR